MSSVFQGIVVDLNRDVEKSEFQLPTYMFLRVFATLHRKIFTNVLQDSRRSCAIIFVEIN